MIIVQNERIIPVGRGEAASRKTRVHRAPTLPMQVSKIKTATFYAYYAMAAVSKKYRNSGMELSTPLFHILQLLYRIHLNLIELHSKHKHIDIFTAKIRTSQSNYY